METRTEKTAYASPRLVDLGDLRALTQLAGSGAVDAIQGVDVDGDGDPDTVIGNGSAALM